MATNEQVKKQKMMGPLDIPTFDNETAWKRFQETVPEKTKTTLLAFYNSIIGGIVTDASCMLLPIDDHLVHRGHAVFDTANVMNGKVYGMKFHSERFFRSAKAARIEHSYTFESLRDIVLATVAASKRTDNVFVRMWLSAGRGDFSITPYNLHGANLFVAVHEKDFKYDPESGGYSEVTVRDVPIKPPALATLKSTNYLLNALQAMAAHERGGHLGLQVQENGAIGECAVSSIAVLGEDGIIRAPKTDTVLRSTTLQRAMELKATLIATGLVKDFVYEDIKLEDAFKAKELIDFGGGFTAPIVKLDDKPIGDGKVGPVFQAIEAMLMDDMLKCDDVLDLIPTTA